MKRLNLYKSNITALLLCIMLFSTEKHVSATQWVTYFCYYPASIDCDINGYDYLYPKVYGSYGLNLPKDLMDILVAHNPVFEYDSLKVTDNNDKFHLFISLRASTLSHIETQQLITTMLLQRYDKLTIDYGGRTEKTYTKKDIDIPFFLPVYFFDDWTCSNDFIHNALELARIAFEKDVNASDWCYTEDEIAWIRQYSILPPKPKNALYVLLAVSILLNIMLLLKRKFNKTKKI